MEDKKYEIVEDDFIIHEGRKLYRIKALRVFSAGGRYTISRGDLGGYIEEYHNLSQEGSCWIFKDDSKVYGNARIKDGAIIFDKAEVFGNAVIKDIAQVNGGVVYGNATVKYNANVKEGAKIYGNAKIENNVVLYNSEIYGNAIIKGATTVRKKQRFMIMLL